MPVISPEADSADLHRCPFVHVLIGQRQALRAAYAVGPPEPGPRPYTKPWEHLRDLDALSEQLGAALG